MTDLFAFHLIIQEPTGAKRRFELSPGVTLIGRQPGVALQLDQAKISRQHAKIDCREAECAITDLGSANGTRLNGKKLQPQVPYPLDPGAEISIGDYILVFGQTRVEAPPPSERVDSLIDVVAVPAHPEEEPQAEDQPGAEEPELAPILPAVDETAAEHPPEIPATPPVTPPAMPPPPLSGAALTAPHSNNGYLPGSSGRSRFLIQYLPESYRSDFMESFLGLFESILQPIEWNIDNFDLFLSPGTSPAFFLPWLENWYCLTPDATWTEDQRRELLREAHQLFAMRGTKWALSRMLEIYTGQKPEINDTGKNMQPYTFTVLLKGKELQGKREFIQKIIEENKPAHTTFTLEIEG